MRQRLKILAMFVAGIYFGLAQAHAPVADLEYMPPIPAPAFPQASGPVVRIDEAHHNYHTLDGSYAAFANLLRRDGFRMEASKSELSQQALDGVSVLVIANAEADQTRSQSTNVAVSAFTEAEISVLHQWVEHGGSLLIIADHPPFSDSTTALAKAFGFDFMGGVALVPNPAGQFKGIAVFETGKGLMSSAPSRGMSPTDHVDAVMTFTGSAFKVPAAATPVLVFQEGARSFSLRQTGPDLTGPSVPLAGLSQGAILELGKGRVAMFGEAAMFTAQRGGPKQEAMGMNTPAARRNYQFVLNLMHWLSRAKGMQE